MIEAVNFKNFKTLKDVECGLSQLTVLVGPNGSGKSTFLQGMHLLSKVVQTQRDFKPEYLFRGSQTLLQLRSSEVDDADLVLECETNGDAFEFRASTIPQHHGSWHDCGENWFCKFTEKTTDEPNEAQSTIASLGYYDLQHSYLARPSIAEDEVPYLQHTGEGLASMIAYLILSAPDSFTQLMAMVRIVVPQLQTIRVQKKKITRIEKETVSIRDKTVTTRVPRTVIGESLVFDFINRKNVTAFNVSEGTMLVIGLLTLLHGPSRPEIILLDDIEKGLHPDAQRELIVLLRQILAKRSDLQIVATSHSPYFLDFLKFDEVRVMALGSDGYSICGRLESHAKFEKWKEELAPGEMWSLFGEKWLSEGAK